LSHETKDRGYKNKSHEKIVACCYPVFLDVRNARPECFENQKRYPLHRCHHQFGHQGDEGESRRLHGYADMRSGFRFRRGFLWLSYVDYRKTENHHSSIPLYFVDPNAKIDGVKFCGRSYAHLNVRIENLAKKQWADGAKFIIGSNLLGKEKVWNFNLKTSTIDANGAMADKVMWKIKCTKNSDLMGSCVLAVSFCAKGKLRYPVFDTAADMSCKSQCSGKESGSADKTLLIFDDFQTYVSSPISESVIGMQIFSGHSFSIDYEHNLINVYQ
jgi:hypothetical protein